MRGGEPGGRAAGHAVWWPPRQPWARRVRELRRLLSHETLEDRTWSVLLLDLGIVPVAATAVLAQGADVFAVAGSAVSLGIGVLAVKALDNQIVHRDRVRSRWRDAGVVAAAARYGLESIEPPALPRDDLPRLLRRPFLTKRRLDLVAVYEGRLRGRRLGIVASATARGDLSTAVVGYARLARPHRRIVIGPRAEPVRPPVVGAPPTFAATSRLRGASEQALGLELPTWIAANAPQVAYEVRGHWLACQVGGFDDDLSADDVGVWLAALVGFAERWDRAAGDGRPAPRGAQAR